MTKMYYLRGALGEAHLLKDRQKEIDELLSGDYSGGDLEKLRGHEVYSFRKSEKARLLFSIRKILGRSYLIVLDYLPNHEYDKSRFLQAGVLKHYLEKHSLEYERLAGEELFFDSLNEEQRAAITSAQIPTQGATEYTVLDYYHQQFIELNMNQQEAIAVSLPAVISGAAGSGKSCVSLSLLISYLNAPLEQADTPLLPLLYVSKSRPLVDVIRGIWQELPLAQEHPERIEFKTYDDLLPEEMRDFRHKGETNFHTWYAEYIKHQKRIARTKTLEIPELDAAKAYQELRIACAYDKDSYLKLGERQSCLLPEYRSWFYKIYEDYNGFLASKRELDPALYRWANDKKYALIVVDEAQDLSHQQLIQLGSMAQQGPQGASVAYCMDSHQRLFDERSVRPFLLDHFGIDEKRHIQLKATYRCPIKIVAAANEVIALKHRLAGGIGDKYEATYIAAAAEEKGLGHLAVLAPEQLRELPWLLEQAKQPYCAIVTTKERVEEARAFFQTPLVFTPEEIKGLEYPIIIAYQLYNPNLFDEAQKRLIELGSKKSSPLYRPKAGTQDEHFGPAFNQIYTAYTRAQQFLVLCETRGRHYCLLLDPLRKLADKEPPSSIWLDLQDHVGNWDEQVLIQLDAGNDAIAQAIFITKLGKTLEELQDFLIKHRPKPLPLSVASEPSTSRPFLTAVVPKGVAKIEHKPDKPPKRKKKVSASHKVLSVDFEKPNSVELGHIVTLAKDFTEKRLAVILAVYDESIWKKLYSQEGYLPFVLADLLKEKSNRKVFTACCVNNKKLLKKIPIELLLGHFDFIKSSEELSQLLKKLKELKVYLSNLLFYHSSEELVHFAALKNDCHLLTELHKLGADLDKLDNEGWAPAHFAAQEGHVDVLEALQELGADLNQFEGWTPAHVAAREGHVAVLQALQNLGININEIEGWTPAHVAAQEGQVAVLHALHKLGVDLNKVDNEGWTLAHVAAQEGRIAVLQALKELGVDLNKLDNEGCSPAHIAAQAGYDDVLNFFEKLGVDLNPAEGDTLASAAKSRVLSCLKREYTLFFKPYLDTRKSEQWKQDTGKELDVVVYKPNQLYVSYNP